MKHMFLLYNLRDFNFFAVAEEAVKGIMDLSNLEKELFSKVLLGQGYSLLIIQ